MRQAAGLEDIDIRSLKGDYDLGWNGTGVIRSHLHITDDEIIIREEMPGEIVDMIIADVAAQSAQSKKTVGGRRIGSVPSPIFYLWRKQWNDGPRLHGMLWRAFFMTKFMDSDYSKFRVRHN